MHQVLTAFFLYSVWWHFLLNGIFSCLYLYLSADLFLTTSVFQAESVLYWNHIFWYSHLWAVITQLHEVIKISIHLSKAMKIESEQYINLWIPFISFWAFFQSHLFVVMFWAEGGQNTLKLFMKFCKDLICELLSHIKIEGLGGAKTSCWVLFSGPHGRSAAVSDYENVLMITDRFGIAAHLPYLKRFIYDYNAWKIQIHWIHLIWQLCNIDKLLKR